MLSTVLRCVKLVAVTFSFFFFNDTATTEIYTLSLHDALPTWPACSFAAVVTPLPSPSGCMNALLLEPRDPHPRLGWEGYPPGARCNGPRAEPAGPPCDRGGVNLPPLDLGELVGQAQTRPGVLAVVLMAAAAYLVGAART